MALRIVRWWGASTRPIEALSALVALGWIAALVQPGSPIGSRAAFHIMEAIASFAADPEMVWIGVFTLIFVLQLVGAVLDADCVRYIGAVLATLVYSMSATSFVIATPDSPGVGVYLALAAFNGWVIMRGPSSNGRR